MHSRGLAAVVVALSLPALGAGQSSTLAIINASVVNVRTGQITRNATVVVREGKVVSVGPAAGSASATVDVGGRYLVPGLIDAHTHIATLDAARRALESGVTTVRSAGVSNYADVGLRELVKKGAIAGPDVLAVGYHVRPQLAPEAFLSDPLLAPLMGGVTTVEGLRLVVRTNVSHGVDWIKTMATERAGVPEHDPRKQLYDDVELTAVVSEAGAKAIPVMAHAHGDEGALAAVKAGVRSIEHGTYLSEETLRLMKEEGTYLVPTLAVVRDMIEPGGEYDDPALRVRGLHMVGRLNETVARAHRMGVSVIAGSDTGYRPQGVTRLAHEIAALREVGLEPLDALRAATIRAAELLRIERQVGAIEPGFEADLLAVERNPLEDLRTLQDPLVVLSNGRVAVNRLNQGKTASTTSR